MKYRYFSEYGKVLPLPEVEKPKAVVYNIYDKKAIAFQDWLSKGIPVPDEHLKFFEVDRDESEFEKVWYNWGGFDKPDNYGWAALPKEGESKPGGDWKSVKEFGYPEHNLGVLVFIPDEDFHITSGMWDISNKWVLLDEYRVPDCEVTHYMNMPEIPKEYQKEQEDNNEIMDFLSQHKHLLKAEESKEQVDSPIEAIRSAALTEGKLWVKIDEEGQNHTYVESVWLGQYLKQSTQ